jgi:hypothetical protein
VAITPHLVEANAKGDTMTNITAMKLALDALVMMDRTFDNSYNYRIEDESKVDEAIAALQAALAEPSEPVGEVVSIYGYQSVAWNNDDCPPDGTNLYTHPPVTDIERKDAALRAALVFFEKEPKRMIIVETIAQIKEALE